MNNLEAISLRHRCCAPARTRQDRPILFDSDAIAFEFEMLKQVGDNGLGSERELALLSVQRDLECHIRSRLSASPEISGCAPAV